MKVVQKLIITIFLGLVALFIQGTALKFILPDHTVPDFCLILVVFLAFNEVSYTGALFSFLLGLIFDLSSGVVLGPWSAAFSATYSVLCVVSKRVFLDSIPAAFLVIFISCLLSNFVYTGLLYQFNSRGIDIVFNLQESFITALVAPLVLSFYQWLLIRKWSVFLARGGSAV